MIGGRIYPASQTYPDQRAGEIDTISPTRKSSLCRGVFRSRPSADLLLKDLQSGPKSVVELLCDHYMFAC